MSPAPIYLPQKQNPWELLLPQMASMIMGQSIQHRFAKELLAEKIKAETQARLTEQAGEREWWKEQESTRQAGAERLKGIPQAQEPIDLRLELAKSAQAQGGKPIQTIMTPGGLIPFVDGRPVDRGVTRERIVDIAGKKVLMPRPVEGHAWTTKDGKVVQVKLPAVGEKGFSEKVGGTREEIARLLFQGKDLTKGQLTAKRYLEKADINEKNAVLDLVKQDKFFLDLSPSEQNEKLRKATAFVKAIFDPKSHISLIGKEAGVYDVDGVILHWDGEKVILTETGLENIKLPRTGLRK